MEMLPEQCRTEMRESLPAASVIDEVLEMCRHWVKHEVYDLRFRGPNLEKISARSEVTTDMGTQVRLGGKAGVAALSQKDLVPKGIFVCYP